MRGAKDNTFPRLNLIISFFFKESAGKGCEFVHKSFREYLFAEGVVEIIKNYGRYEKVAQAYKKNPEMGYEEREIDWQEFEDDDPRYELTRRLSELFATHWLSPEIKNHILNLLISEIERSSQIENTSFSEPCTQPISVQQWGYIRDGLADVWDWWAEGVLLRPQPTIIREKKKPIQYTFDAPYVQELAEFCCPLDSESWTPDLPTPVRVNTVDGRLGEAFFHLTAIVHGTLYHYQKQTVPCSISIEKITPTQRRRYQTQQLVKDKNNEDCFLLQFAPSGENGKYFRNCCHRINSSDWRSPHSFPSDLWAVSINLREVDLSGVNLFLAFFGEADLSSANLSGAFLRGADLSSANLRKACLGGADLIAAFLKGADLSKADLREACLLGADLSKADLCGVDLRGAKLIQANLRGADFSRAILTGVDLSKADLCGVRNLTVQQIKEAKNWHLGKYDSEFQDLLEKE